VGKVMWVEQEEGQRLEGNYQTFQLGCDMKNSFLSTNTTARNLKSR
jgi:hypothetical protein